MSSPTEDDSKIAFKTEFTAWWNAGAWNVLRSDDIRVLPESVDVDPSALRVVYFKTPEVGADVLTEITDAPAPKLFFGAVASVCWVAHDVVVIDAEFYGEIRSRRPR